jgi:23S rRNA (guanosine2251-2'-O)-methyltransferase
MSDVFGIQAVRSVLREDPDRARRLYIQRGRRDARVSELISLARDAGVRHQATEPQWFRRRLGDAAHQGVLLECHEVSLAGMEDLLQRWDSLGAAPLLLILDGVTDPRNFGACLRSASGAGVDAVVIPKRNSAPLSAVALKTAQGGVEDLFIVEVTNLARAMKTLREHQVWIVGTDGDAPSAYTEMSCDGPLAIVMGSEDKGLRRLTREHCDQLVHIPMHGSVTSLNVSVATGVLLYEARRQRLVKR